MENNWAVITGASSGIGKEFAYQLGQKGYNVALVARTRDKLEAIAADIKKQFERETRVIALDLTHRDFAQELSDRTADLTVTMVINNAGFGTSGPFLEIEDSRETEMVQLNCIAITQIARLFLKRMVENGEGNMIIVASTASVQPCPWFATYAATKAFDRFLAEVRNETKGSERTGAESPGNRHQFFCGSRTHRQPEGTGYGGTGCSDSLQSTGEKALCYRRCQQPSSLLCGPIYSGKTPGQYCRPHYEEDDRYLIMYLLSSERKARVCKWFHQKPKIHVILDGTDNQNRTDSV